LYASSERLAAVITEEHGKTTADAMGELARGIEIVEFACGIGEHLKGEFADQVSDGIDTMSYRQPVGIALGITPFNFPLMVPLWMAPIAIACGNSFILKPSERDPSASLLLAQAWQEAGLPPGVFNVIHGDRSTAEMLLDAPEVGAVSFVGSTPVAQAIHERVTRRGARVQALGGAKNHAVVLPDADVNYVADQLIAAAYGSTGQRCMAVSVAVAVGSSADPLIASLKQKADALHVGPGTTAKADLGPLTSATACDRIGAALESAKSSGAEIVRDGREIEVSGYEEGYFMGPTIVDHVNTAMAVYTQELFGPVLCVVRVETMEQAIALINANTYGNGVAVFTSDGRAAREFHRAVHVGMIGINVPIPVPVASFSFGGWKGSLFGDHHIYGPEGVRFYTRNKVVTSRWPSSTVAKATLAFPTPS
jgi:malonate-semialdehyde dehydrogenase (acetylating)/methylmalonate-semialdehyde dehydrogenase